MVNQFNSPFGVLTFFASSKKEALVNIHGFLMDLGEHYETVVKNKEFERRAPKISNYITNLTYENLRV